MQKARNFQLKYTLNPLSAKSEQTTKSYLQIYKKKKINFNCIILQIQRLEGKHCRSR